MALADKPLSSITAKDIKDTYTKLLGRSKRRADYAMQVLRAVLRWQGIKIDDNPLSQETAGRNRIVLAPPRGNPQPIPPEKLGAWWLAACACPSAVAGDYYRFQLLTGCRGGEIVGDKKYDYPPILVGDVDLQAGTTVQGHGLRATFTSIAEELVSGGVLKRVLNHATSSDVTLGHYVGKSEAQLRAGWQVVEDFIEAAARKANSPDVDQPPAGDLPAQTVEADTTEDALP